MKIKPAASETKALGFLRYLLLKKITEAAPPATSVILTSPISGHTLYPEV